MKTMLILASLVLSVSALAQVPANRPSSTSPSASTSASTGATQAQPTFESLDANSDGRISIAEAQASPSLAAKFSMLDRQNKGYITRDEYLSFMRDENTR